MGINKYYPKPGTGGPGQKPKYPKPGTGGPGQKPKYPKPGTGGPDPRPKYPKPDIDLGKWGPKRPKKKKPRTGGPFPPPLRDINNGGGSPNTGGPDPRPRYQNPNTGGPGQVPQGSDQAYSGGGWADGRRFNENTGKYEYRGGVGIPEMGVGIPNGGVGIMSGGSPNTGGPDPRPRYQNPNTGGPGQVPYVPNTGGPGQVPQGSGQFYAGGGWADGRIFNENTGKYEYRGGVGIPERGVGIPRGGVGIMSGGATQGTPTSNQSRGSWQDQMIQRLAGGNRLPNLTGQTPYASNTGSTQVPDNMWGYGGTDGGVGIMSGDGSVSSLTAGEGGGGGGGGGEGGGGGGGGGGGEGGGEGGGAGIYGWVPPIRGGYEWKKGEAEYEYKKAIGEEQQRRYETWLKERKPYLKSGRKSLARLGRMRAPTFDPFSFRAIGKTAPFKFRAMGPLEETNAYKFRLGQGQKSIEAGAAARGGLFSGRAGKELQAFGQNMASQEAQAQWQRYTSDRKQGFDEYATQRQLAFGEYATQRQLAFGEYATQRQLTFGEYQSNWQNLFDMAYSRAPIAVPPMQGVKGLKSGAYYFADDGSSTVQIPPWLQPGAGAGAGAGDPYAKMPEVYKKPGMEGERDAYKDWIDKGGKPGEDGHIPNPPPGDAWMGGTDEEYIAWKKKWGLPIEEPPMPKEPPPPPPPKPKYGDTPTNIQ